MWLYKNEGSIGIRPYWTWTTNWFVGHTPASNARHRILEDFPQHMRTRPLTFEKVPEYCQRFRCNICEIYLEAYTYIANIWMIINEYNKMSIFGYFFRFQGFKNTCSSSIKDTGCPIHWFVFNIPGGIIVPLYQEG